jgi:DNA invertase Pin-like site-specific DNA recombinase
MNDKISDLHLTRKAILYVRQSSAHQVTHNAESRRMQYAMKERLQELGWKEIEVIDEDQGRSAAGTTERSGFDRMVSDVCLGRVGVVAARELSRFSRNSRDWQQLIEVCRVVHTLLVDHETVYDPRRSNDRLLLGVKGSLNEYELDVLRQRAWEARLEKAKRGELVLTAPVGFIKNDTGPMEMDPDRRVQEALHLVFRKFRQLGSVRQTLFWFLESDLELPARQWDGNLWTTVWKRPRYGAVYKILTHPAYGGAYSYGQSEQVIDFHDSRPRKRRRRRKREEWLALIPGHHEGYIDWEQYERNRKAIADNMTSRFPESPSAPKHGPALLAGLLRCRRCGKKLLVGYTGREANVIRYMCCRGNLDTGTSRCITFGGARVDAFVANQVLRVVKPSAVEAALRAAEKTVCQRSDILETLGRNLEAAHYATDRAWKQYDGVDPENRLVADELERRWNEALSHRNEIENRIAEEQTNQEKETTPEFEDFLRIAEDLRVVWDAPETDMRLKKRILRTLIHEILVDTDSHAGEVLITIHWNGGVHTQGVVKRRRHGQNSLHTSTEIVDAVAVLSKICPDHLIAGILNRNGLQTGKGNRWTQERVTSLRAKRKMPRYSDEQREAAGWVTLTDASKHLDVCPSTLRAAAERGIIPVEHPLSLGPWVFCRSDLESTAAKTLVESTRRRTKGGAARCPEQRELEFHET